VEGTTITVQAALNGGFGASVPLNGDLLYDVAGISLVGGADADSTAPFDYKLEERIGRTTGKGRHIVGAGTLRGSGAARARFKVDVLQQKTGTVTLTDPGRGVRFVSSKILKVRLVRTRSAQISGTGKLGSSTVSFVATLVDGGPGDKHDRFSISIGGRYRRGGPLLSGNVTIR
jgi:hypothetical protein